MDFSFPYEKLTLKDLMEYTSESDKFQNAIVVLDEIHIFIDSRRSVSSRNVIISYFLTQTRKKGVLLFWTSQQAHQVDKRLRSNSDFIIECSKTKIGEMLIVINDIIVMDGRTFKEWFIGNDYFEFYDTTQTISIE